MHRAICCVTEGAADKCSRSRWRKKSQDGPLWGRSRLGRETCSGVGGGDKGLLGADPWGGRGLEPGQEEAMSRGQGDALGGWGGAMGAPVAPSVCRICAESPAPEFKHVRNERKTFLGMMHSHVFKISEVHASLLLGRITRESSRQELFSQALY